ncbi:3-oxoacyl-ACP reductase [Enemella evansiae]|uniref:SDR family NAD(P)-dependent oxidoreductase n=1 Tax=Enemella evansiae TaxID=2016499 RepID=UPI000B964A91|nr:SDR family NAD(P)-dependent oxidoreductase [Enemella evansiae]OYN97171.1 3-oxoacyl-ACP reductase [Enemella evansiae]OYO13025.1 3-oxoacyl-ACP reductase [Enemella evansiae]
MDTVVLTGATSGLGAGLTRELADRADHLILHGRDTGRLDAVAATARDRGARVTTLTVDLGDPLEARGLCARVRELAGRLDLVINNAAVGGGADPEHRETNRYGTELRMAANVIAPHLIASELWPVMPPNGRIVQVGSAGQAPLEPSDLDFTRGYQGVEAYLRSKLALIMDTIDLAARGIWVNVVHPADRMPTTMVRESGLVPHATIDDGLLPVLRVALDTELAGITGRYFDRFELAEPHPQAADPVVRQALQRWIGDQLALAGV